MLIEAHQSMLKLLLSFKLGILAQASFTVGRSQIQEGFLRGAQIQIVDLLRKLSTIKNREDQRTSVSHNYVKQ
jgi:hypothetical protein